MTIFNIRPPDDSIGKVTLGAINASLGGGGCGRGLSGGSSYCGSSRFRGSSLRGSSASVGVAFFNSAKLMREFLIATVLIKQINKRIMMVMVKYEHIDNCKLSIYLILLMNINVNVS